MATNSDVQWSTCRECGELADTRKLRHEPASSAYPYGRDLCQVCAPKFLPAPPRMAEVIVAKVAVERPAPRPDDPLTAARLDYDVAMASARDAYDAAIARAEQALIRATDNAETCWRMAQARATRDDLQRTREANSYAVMDDDTLISKLRMQTFRLVRSTARMRPEDYADANIKVRAMTAELNGRGVEIPRWRFQDRTPE